MTVEAAWLKNSDDGATEIWAKCPSCHTDRMVATNISEPPEGQPFFACILCGQFLFAPNSRDVLVKLVVDHGWSRAVTWLMAQGIGDGDD